MSSVSAEKKIWTMLDILNWGTTYLDEKGFDESRITIELLLSHVLKFQRIQLYTNFDRPLSPDELATFKKLLKRRLTHEPLQYIIGETEFMGLKFSVDTRVLIPRPETELLVELAVQKLKERFSAEEKIFILDCGTGSGCIAITIAKLLPTAVVTAIDASIDALEIAKANADNNGVQERIEFLHGDIFEFDALRVGKTFHAVVSNPPYVSQDEFLQLQPEVLNFEPKEAILAKENGLQFYPALATIAQRNLIENGFVIVEHQFNQSEAVQNIFREQNLAIISTIKDYDGNFRHVAAER